MKRRRPSKILDCQRLEHMRRAVSAIRKLVTGVTRRQFLDDEKACAAAAHYFAVIGEAANHVSDALKAKHRDVAWQEAVAMRNLVVHEYFDVSYVMVWDTAKHDLPRLSRQIDSIISELPPAPPVPKEVDSL